VDRGRYVRRQSRNTNLEKRKERLQLSGSKKNWEIISFRVQGVVGMVFIPS
jgi:hypothetical protein